MKKLSIYSVVLGAVLFSSPFNVSALELAGKGYITGEMGAAFMHDLELKDTGANLEFDPGVRGSAMFGYNLNKDAAVELETGVLWTSADKFGPFEADTEMYQVPLLVNFIYKLPITYNSPVRGRLVPYFGLGLGGVLTTVDITFSQNSFSGDDFTFAYQPFAGLRYALTDRLDLSIAYKFLGSLDHEWTDGPITIKTDSSMTHTFMAGLSFKF